MQHSVAVIHVPTLENTWKSSTFVHQVKCSIVYPHLLNSYFPYILALANTLSISSLYLFENNIFEK